MQNKTKRLSVLLGLALGAPAVVAPVVMPSHAPAAIAQETAEYPDVPQNHWAYDAINKLSQAGIIEGMPNGTYMGNKPMTRYEFAVAVARILDKTSVAAGQPGPQGPAGEPGATGPQGPAGEDATVSDDWVKRAELTDAINALRNEFSTELKALGVRVDDLDKRVTDIENRLAKPPRLTVTPSILFRGGSSNYNLSNVAGGVVGGGDPAAAFDDFFNSQHQYSYLDFSLRLADRVSDNVTLNAEIRSLTGNMEDPIGLINNLGGLLGGGGIGGPFGAGIGLDTNLYIRQANAVVDLNSLQLIAGRQHTKIAQGLLYDNDYLPTDQFQAKFSLGPVNVAAFIGSTNNNLGIAPYQLSGQALAFAVLGGPNGLTGFPAYAGGGGVGPLGSIRLEDSESLVRGSLDLFKISGKPVQLGASYLFNGVAEQKGWGADLTLPLFNRNVGIEYVSQSQYADGTDSDGSAYNITVPVLRTKSVDLDVAYGKANDDYEYFLSSAANPYVRTWAESIFDRPMALGAPLINGADGSNPPLMAVKKAWDVNATLRFINKLPINVRWYNAKGTDGVDLGNVWSVGTNYQLTQGLDLELKYGQYNPKGDIESLKYFRIGANVGF